MASPQTIPVTNKKLGALLQRLYTALDERILPYPVKFLTNRIIILATLALLIPLVFFTNDQSFVNTANSYLNVISVVVSSTVLLYETMADARDRDTAKRTEEAAKSYEQVLEGRVQADHELIQQILQNSLETTLGGRLEKIRLEDHKKLEDMQKAMIISNDTLGQELAELKVLVQALHQSHLGKSTVSSP